jgi:hypothetical protein
MVFVLVGGTTLYLREEVFDAGAFADRAASSLTNSDIRGAISDIVVATAIEKGTTELLQAKPLLQIVVDGAMRRSTCTRRRSRAMTARRRLTSPTPARW